jgi:hypothetical protein
MKNITLTANGTGREVMVNWDNVQLAKETKTVYGDDYVEIHFGNNTLDVKETLQEIHAKCLDLPFNYDQ